MPNLEAGAGIEHENIIDDQEKAQSWANLIKRTALQRSAERVFLNEFPEDYQRLALLHEGSRIGYKLTEEQREERSKLERKLVTVREEILSGERAVDPEKSDYEAAEEQWGKIFDAKRGPVGNAFFGLLKKMAENSATRDMIRRSQRLGNHKNEV